MARKESQRKWVFGYQKLGGSTLPMTKLLEFGLQFWHTTGLPQNPSSTAGISQYFLATGFRMVGEALQRFWLLMFSRSCQFVSRRCDLLNLLVGCSTPNISCRLLSLLMTQGHVHKSHWMSAIVSTSAHCCNTSQQLTTGFTLLENIVF